MYGYCSCPSCGVTVAAGELAAGTHVCNEDQLIAHQEIKLQNFEGELTSYWAQHPEELGKVLNIAKFHAWLTTKGRW